MDSGLQIGKKPAQSISACSECSLPALMQSQCNALAAGVTRWGALASTGIALVGLMKLNLQGPGITETVRQLWRK